MKKLRASIGHHVALWICFCVAPFAVRAQVISPDRTTDWSKAGFIYEQQTPELVVSILDHGGVGDGITLNNAAILQAFAAANGQAAVIEFPPGQFMFTNGILMPDSIVLRGAGSDQTTLIFDLGGTGHCINFIGQEIAETYPLAQNVTRGDTSVLLASVFPFQNGDLLRFYRPDEELVVSPWAIGSTGQLVHIELAGDATIFLASPMRANYPLSGSYVRNIDPCMSSGIECLKITRVDETEGQFSNIRFNKASHCWVRGVESDITNFSHIELFESTNCEITGNHLHHAFSYGSGGKGYGVNIFHTSGSNLVQDNIIGHLRHAMIVHIGANGNVFGYNHSYEPYWEEGIFPANSAGDIVFHGDHPYLNLFEGNTANNMVVDDSHGSNGPFNTLFRNRADLYGLVMSADMATDSMNILGNSIPSTAPFQGMFAVQGEGHFLYGNIHQESIVPPGTYDLTQASLYLDGNEAFLSPLPELPQIGPNSFPPGSNPAALRFATGGELTICSAGIGAAIHADRSTEITLRPNPFTDRFTMTGLDVTGAVRVEIYDVQGAKVVDRQLSGMAPLVIDALGHLPSSAYILRIVGGGNSYHHLLVKE